MDTRLYDFLSAVIDQGTVSVMNIPDESQYLVLFTDGDVEQVAILSSRYLITIGKEVYIQYAVVMNNEIIAAEIAPLIHRAPAKLSDAPSIEQLMEKCSAKVMQTEFLRQQNRMFYSMVGNDLDNVH